MTQRWAKGGLVRVVAVVLLLVLATGSGLGALAQEDPVVERIYRTLNLLPQTDLPSLVRLAIALQQTPELQALLMEAPREYLAKQTIAAPIALAADAFQITAIDFSIKAETDEGAWFGVAEPLEGYVFEPKGLGIFYRSVGIFIQEAHEPAAGEAAGMALRDGSPIEQVEAMLALVDRFTPEALETLRDAMKELNKLGVDSPERSSFLHNPREYLLGRELTLPASTYRIVAIDFDRAATLNAVKSDRIRAGLAVIPEGIGVFGAEVGIFLQLAI